MVRVFFKCLAPKTSGSPELSQPFESGLFANSQIAPFALDAHLVAVRCSRQASNLLGTRHERLVSFEANARDCGPLQALCKESRDG